MVVKDTEAKGRLEIELGNCRGWMDDVDCKGDFDDEDTLH